VGGSIVIVAIEQYVPSHQRIIIDDLAYSVLPFSARALIWAMRPPLARNWMVRATERAFLGLWSGIICRKRYIDEALIAASREIGAVVNLGAGFDTQAYRLPSLAFPGRGHQRRHAGHRSLRPDSACYMLRTRIPTLHRRQRRACPTGCRPSRRRAT